MLSQGNLNFLNVRNAGLWHSGRLFEIKKILLQMLSLQNLEESFGDHPFNFPLTPPSL